MLNSRQWLSNGRNRKKTNVLAKGILVWLIIVAMLVDVSVTLYAAVPQPIPAAETGDEAGVLPLVGSISDDSLVNIYTTAEESMPQFDEDDLPETAMVSFGGTVYDAELEIPLSGANVFLLFEEEIRASAQTDEHGIFYISAVLIDEDNMYYWSLFAELEGFEIDEIELTDIYYEYDIYDSYEEPPFIMSHVTVDFYLEEEEHEWDGSSLIFGYMYCYHEEVPLVGATVMLRSYSGETFRATTDEHGFYEIYFPVIVVGEYEYILPDLGALFLGATLIVTYEGNSQQYEFENFFDYMDEYARVNASIDVCFVVEEEEVAVAFTAALDVAIAPLDSGRAPVRIYTSQQLNQFLLGTLPHPDGGLALNSDTFILAADVNALHRNGTAANALTTAAGRRPGIGVNGMALHHTGRPVTPELGNAFTGTFMGCPDFMQANNGRAPHINNLRLRPNTRREAGTTNNPYLPMDAPTGLGTGARRLGHNDFGFIRLLGNGAVIQDITFLNAYFYDGGSSGTGTPDLDTSAIVNRTDTGAAANQARVAGGHGQDARSGGGNINGGGGVGDNLPTHRGIIAGRVYPGATVTIHNVNIGQPFEESNPVAAGGRLTTATHGHAINNISTSRHHGLWNARSGGMFGRVGAGATVNISDSDVAIRIFHQTLGAGQQTGGIAGNTDEGATLNLSNVNVAVEMTESHWGRDSHANNTAYAGGIVGRSGGSISIDNGGNAERNTIFATTIREGQTTNFNNGTGGGTGSTTGHHWGRFNNVGRITSFSAGPVYASDVNLTGDISGLRDIGGAVGSISAPISLTNVNISGVVGGTQSNATATGASARERGWAAGGVVGRVIGEDSRVTLENVSVGSAVSGGRNDRTQDGVGGVVGVAAGGFTAADINVNIPGSISGSHNVGGMVGLVSGGAAVINNPIFTMTGIVEGISANGSGVGGLIGSATSGATISNITVSHTVTSNGTNVGGVIGRVQGGPANLTNVTATGNVNGPGRASSTAQGRNVNSGVGGVIGTMASGTLRNVSFDGGTITAPGNVGGVVGRVTGAASIYSATARGTMALGSGAAASGYRQLSRGGIVGRITPTGTASLNFVTNYMNVTANRGDAGGIIGRTQGRQVLVANATNRGAITISAAPANLICQWRSVGGIIGNANNTNITIADSVNHANLHGNTRRRGVAGMVGHATGASTMITLQRVENHGTITHQQTARGNPGGLIGWTRGSATIMDSVNRGTVQRTGDVGNAVRINTSGGLAGMVSRNLVIDNSANYGDVTSAQRRTIRGMGGLVGYVRGNTTITNSHNHGNIWTHQTTGSAAVQRRAHQPMANMGGIIGRSDMGGVSSGQRQTVLTNVANHGTIGTNTANNAAGGIIGYTRNRAGTSYVLTNVTNTASVRAQSHAGGIIGRSNARNVTITDVVNHGNITVTRQRAHAAGIVGRTTRDTLTIVRAYNRGNIEAQAAGGNVNARGRNGSTGGLVGLISGGTVNIRESFNVGLVHGRGISVGGLVGISRGRTPLNITDSYNLGSVRSLTTNAAGNRAGNGILGRRDRGNVNMLRVFGAANVQGRPIYGDARLALNRPMGAYINFNSVFYDTTVHTGVAQPAGRRPIGVDTDILTRGVLPGFTTNAWLSGTMGMKYHPSGEFYDYDNNIMIPGVFARGHIQNTYPYLAWQTGGELEEMFFTATVRWPNLNYPESPDAVMDLPWIGGHSTRFVVLPEDRAGREWTRSFIPYGTGRFTAFTELTFPSDPGHQDMGVNTTPPGQQAAPGTAHNLISHGVVSDNWVVAFDISDRSGLAVMAVDAEDYRRDPLTAELIHWADFDMGRGAPDFEPIHNHTPAAGIFIVRYILIDGEVKIDANAFAYYSYSEWYTPNSSVAPTIPGDSGNIDYFRHITRQMYAANPTGTIRIPLERQAISNVQVRVVEHHYPNATAETPTIRRVPSSWLYHERLAPPEAWGPYEQIANQPGAVATRHFPLERDVYLRDILFAGAPDFSYTHHVVSISDFWDYDNNRPQSGNPYIIYVVIDDLRLGNITLRLLWMEPWTPPDTDTDFPDPYPTRIHTHPNRRTTGNPPTGNPGTGASARRIVSSNHGTANVIATQINPVFTHPPYIVPSSPVTIAPRFPANANNANSDNYGNNWTITNALEDTYIQMGALGFRRSQPTRLGEILNECELEDCAENCADCFRGHDGTANLELERLIHFRVEVYYRTRDGYYPGTTEPRYVLRPLPARYRDSLTLEFDDDYETEEWTDANGIVNGRRVQASGNNHFYVTAVCGEGVTLSVGEGNLFSAESHLVDWFDDVYENRTVAELYGQTGVHNALAAGGGGRTARRNLMVAPPAGQVVATATGNANIHFIWRVVLDPVAPLNVEFQPERFCECCGTATLCTILGTVSYGEVQVWENVQNTGYTQRYQPLTEVFEGRTINASGTSTPAGHPYTIDIRTIPNVNPENDLPAFFLGWSSPQFPGQFFGTTDEIRALPITYPGTTLFIAHFAPDNTRIVFDLTVDNVPYDVTANRNQAITIGNAFPIILRDLDPPSGYTHTVIRDTDITLRQGTLASPTNLYFFGWYRVQYEPCTLVGEAPTRTVDVGTELGDLLELDNFIPFLPNESATHVFTMPSANVKYYAVWGADGLVGGRSNDLIVTNIGNINPVVGQTPESETNVDSQRELTWYRGTVVDQGFLGWVTPEVAATLSVGMSFANVPTITPPAAMPPYTLHVVGVWGLNNIIGGRYSDLTVSNFGNTLGYISSSQTPVTAQRVAVNTSLTWYPGHVVDGDQKFLGWVTPETRATLQIGDSFIGVPTINPPSTMPNNDLHVYAIWGLNNIVGGTASTLVVENLGNLSDPVGQSPVSNSNVAQGAQLAPWESGTVVNQEFLGWVTPETAETLTAGMAFDTGLRITPPANMGDAPVHVVAVWGIDYYVVGPVIDITVTKLWYDHNNLPCANTNVTYIEIELFADNNPVPVATATMTAPATGANAVWTYTFTNMPRLSAPGATITYTASEKNVPAGYISDAVGLTITNTRNIVEHTVTFERGNLPTDVIVTLPTHNPRGVREGYTVGLVTDAKAGADWRFDGWVQSGPDPAVRTSLEVANIPVYGDTTFTARWTRMHLLELTSNPADAPTDFTASVDGTAVAPAATSDQTIQWRIPYGARVTITRPYNTLDWIFVDWWYGDATGGRDELSVNLFMDGDRNVTANWGEPDPSIALDRRTHDFGTWAGNIPAMRPVTSFRVTNTGNVAITLDGIPVIPNFEFVPLNNNLAGVVLQPGEYRYIYIAPMFALVPGSHSQYFRVTGTCPQGSVVDIGHAVFFWIMIEGI